MCQVEFCLRIWRPAEHAYKSSAPCSILSALGLAIVTMANGQKTGLLDLESELTCSICTEILYQPLTLINCLHTFCGSCLKEWFASQKANAHAHTSNPYTCPSCRAPVLDARPDSKVTTLLDMFISVNPTSAKTTEEKEDIAKRYKAGENVTPVSSRIDPAGSDEDERRMLEEVREMSLRDTSSRGPRGYERGARHHTGTRDARDHEARQRRRRELARGEDGHPRSSRNSPARDAIRNADSRSQARRIEHQSSLRSLLSNSEADRSDMEEEILRQIMEDGLLEGIDLDNMSGSQEDALYERIADAYRRRHTPNNHSSSTSPRLRSTERASARHHSPGSHRSPAHSNESHPPVSHSDLLEAYPIGSGHHTRRASGERRRQTSPAERSPVTQTATRSATDLASTPLTSSQGTRQAARSATDLSIRSPNTTGRPSQLDEHHREQSRMTESRPHSSDGPRGSTTDSRLANRPRPGHSSAESRNLSLDSVPHVSQAATPGNERRAPLIPLTSSPPASTTIERPSTSVVAPPPSQPSLFLEPAISCDRCNKPNLEYTLHENCSICRDGNYNLCHRCYLLGKGCLHWYGFGHAAWFRFQQQGSAQAQLPHTLNSRRYTRPAATDLCDTMGSNGKLMATKDPATRLQTGAFCSICQKVANDCYWKCDSCNEGEWGYCNSCVNRGKCCTHPLLPLQHISYDAKSPHSPPAHPATSSFSPITSPRTLQSFHATSDLLSPSPFKPLHFSTNCDICKYPIQPSQTRFHCYECNGGNHDICRTCYPRLVSKGLISRSNGEHGWRRCQSGHRMVVVGFDDSNQGQRRIIMQDLVGGHFVRDEAEDLPTSHTFQWKEGETRKTKVLTRGSEAGTGTAWRKEAVGSVGASGPSSQAASPPPMLQKYPPDGGWGLQVQALWSYWPEDSKDLGFPKGAELRELEDVNGDWYLGCYAGQKGLIPAGYFKVLRVVGR